jgi:tetratricopeptide (TPR) repeat protein
MRLKAAAYKMLGKLDQSESHIRSALLLAKVYGARVESVRLHLLLGYLQYDRATLDRAVPTKARETFLQAAANAESLNELYCTLEAKIALGRCALSMKETTKAQKLLERFSEELPAGKHAELQIGVAFSLAAVAHQNGQLEEAAMGYEEVVRYSVEHGFRLWNCLAMIGLGATQHHLGNTDDAAVKWANALKLASQISGTKRVLAQIQIEKCQADSTATP